MEAIYVEQDLYCLGTSHGTNYEKWPKISFDFCDADVFMPRDSRGVRETNRPSTLEAMSAVNVRETVKQRLEIIADQDKGHTGPDTSAHACLRRVELRNPPYEHLVERRCVWKFAVVDNPGKRQYNCLLHNLTKDLINTL